MNAETCRKYFDFLITECERYIEDRKIEEDEIHQLKIEFDRFLEKIVNSDLPSDLKTRITELNLDYTFNSNRDYFEFLGRWNPVKHRRKARLLKSVEDFKFEISALSNYIKLNFLDFQDS